jgi:hypothetical protein
MSGVLWSITDWWLAVAEALERTNPLVMILLSLVLLPPTVFLHECGHAIPALLLTRQPVDMHVGSDGAGVRFRAGRLRMTLQPGHRRGAPGAGWVHARGTHRAMLAVAAGGPLASLLGAVAGAALAPHLGTGLAGMLDASFVVESGMAAILNLLPIEGKVTDGTILYARWRLLRLPPPPRQDPNASTSVGPPGR